MHTIRNGPRATIGHLIVSLRLCLVMFTTCGLLYSVVTTVTAKLLFPEQASGSLIERNGRPIGSALIGQSFTSKHYFHGRPSVANYNPLMTAGSNLAPNNPELGGRVSGDSLRIQRLENVEPSAIPVDSLSASGSGLDPHISPASALMQIPRIAKARNLDATVLKRLLAEHTEGPQFGFLGRPRVNVLRLNLALDRLQAVPSSSTTSPE